MYAIRSYYDLEAPRKEEVGTGDHQVMSDSVPGVLPRLPRVTPAASRSQASGQAQGTDQQGEEAAAGLRPGARSRDACPPCCGEMRSRKVGHA